MALDIVKRYITLISELFKLSDVSVMTSAMFTNVPPPLLPLNSHSICTAHYLRKILADIRETTNDLTGLDISPDTGIPNLVESVKWRFLDILTGSWLRGRSVLPLWMMHVLTKFEFRRQNILLRGDLGIKFQ